MQASKIRTVATVLAYIAVALVLVAVVGLVYRFTNGFNEDFKTFYIEQDGKQILSSSSTMSFKADTTYRFDVKYTFDTEQSEPKDYSVKVMPNAGRDFDFTVDGERYLYSKQGELSVAFSLNKQDTYFEISTQKETSLQNVLQSCYPDKEVVVPKEAEESNAYPYTLVVASYNESVVYEIDFCVGVKVTGVTLDPSEIIFTGSGDFDEEVQEPSVPAETYSIGYDTLGYISLGSLAPNADKVQAVKVEGVDATVENVVNKSYKLSRPFNLVWNEQRFNANDLAVNFVNFIESEAGQEIIGEEGYVTVSGLQIKTYTAYTGTKTVLNITGSTSVEPLMRKFVAAYTELNPGITVNIDAQGSGQGITGAQEGTNDIGMSSRDLKSSETGIVSHKIADDGIAVIVKKGSKLTNVTFDQLFNLYMKGTAIEAK